jgi:cell division protease FtsH
MSPLGPIAYGDPHDTVFLGREITRNESLSEETARRIDQEIHNIIDTEYKRAVQILTDHRPALDKIAAALLEFETIDGKHVSEILQFGEIRTPVVTAAPPKLEPAPAKKPAGKPMEPEPISPAAAPNPA